MKNSNGKGSVSDLITPRGSVFSEELLEDQEFDQFLNVATNLVKM
jgi:hypothetical protein